MDVIKVSMIPTKVQYKRRGIKKGSLQVEEGTIRNLSFKKHYQSSATAGTEARSTSLIASVGQTDRHTPQP